MLGSIYNKSELERMPISQNGETWNYLGSLLEALLALNHNVNRIAGFLTEQQNPERRRKKYGDNDQKHHGREIKQRRYGKKRRRRKRDKPGRWHAPPSPERLMCSLDHHVEEWHVLLRRGS